MSALDVTLAVRPRADHGREAGGHEPFVTALPPERLPAWAAEQYAQIQALRRSRGLRPVDLVLLLDPNRDLFVVALDEEFGEASVHNYYEVLAEELPA